MDENREMGREAKYRIYRDERMAQEIRENSQELRELETRIRAAYVTKTLKLQLAEREKQRLLEKIHIENDLQRMKQKLQEDAERDRQRKEEIRLKQQQHRKELLEQIADKQFKRKILYEEFLKEKIIIDDIMAQIEREQMEYVIRTVLVGQAMAIVYILDTSHWLLESKTIPNGLTCGRLGRLKLVYLGRSQFFV